MVVPGSAVGVPVRARENVTVFLLCAGVGTHGMNGSWRYAVGLLSGFRSGTFIDSVRLIPEQVDRSSRRGRLRELRIVGSRALFGLPGYAPLNVQPGRAVLHSVESVSVPGPRRVPIVVTAHDVCALLRPDLVSFRLGALKRLTWRRKHAWDAVIVPSASTRDDVLALGIREERVVVIRHGLAPVFQDEPQTKSLAWVESCVRMRPYVLVASPPSLKKGSDVLLKTWSRVARGTDMLLVWVGWDDEHARRLLPGASEFSRESLMGLREVTDAQLVALYHRAQAVVVPSRYEGYSFCVTEALSAGTPVVASDIPAHREFSSRAIHLFCQKDRDELADLLLSAFRGDLAREKVAFPTWEECARSHAEVYKRVAFNANPG